VKTNVVCLNHGHTGESGEIGDEDDRLEGWTEAQNFDSRWSRLNLITILSRGQVRC